MLSYLKFKAIITMREGKQMRKLKNNVVWIFKGLKEIHSIRSGLLSLIVIRSIISALSPFVNIYISALIINSIAEKQPFERLLFLAVITVTINLMIALISSVLNHIISIRQSEFNTLYKMNRSRKIMNMKYSSVEEPETHYLHQKIIEAANMNNGGIIGLLESIKNFVQSIFTIIFSISITISLFFTPRSLNTPFESFITSPWLSVLIFLAILINVFVSMYSNSTMTKKMYLLMNNAIQFNRVFDYYLENYITNYHTGKDIRVYNQLSVIKSEYLSLLNTARLLIKKISRNQAKYSMLITVSTTLLSCIIYLYIGIKALLGLFGVGYIVQYIGSITQFATGFTEFMTQLAILKTNNKVLKIYFEFFNMPDDINQGTLPVKKNCTDEYKIEIEFKNVSFKYPHTENYVIKNLNLKLSTGKSFAIVGRNGSGKTTMIKLLLRLYVPTEGQITLNGIDIQEYQYNDYIDIFGVVFQDFKIFSFSLGQNVSARMCYDQSKAKACLAKAGFSDRLANMSKDLDTCLYKDFEEDGVEISGGEAQKIALARALYKDAPFIILDEPTAALDPIAEYEIYSKFNEIVENKTAIYISHRLSSCRFCQNIIVFDNGQIVQSGSHEELVTDENGKYYELWHAQAQYYTE